MELWEKIKSVYPDLTNQDFEPDIGVIQLQDDSDGIGAYILKWEYDQPIPAGLKLGKQHNL